MSVFRRLTAIGFALAPLCEVSCGGRHASVQCCPHLTRRAACSQVDIGGGGQASSSAMLKTLAKYYKLLCAATKLVRRCCC